jgi:hypothetical protein
MLPEQLEGADGDVELSAWSRFLVETGGRASSFVWTQVGSGRSTVTE